MALLDCDLNQHAAAFGKKMELKGLKIVPSVAEQNVLAEMRKAESECDMVIIDLPGGSSTLARATDKKDDRNVFTSGGVTSGIDFAFSIVAELAGPEVAHAIQLAIEYDPSPPFEAGHPDKASGAAVELMMQRNAAARSGMQQNLQKIGYSRLILGERLG